MSQSIQLPVTQVGLEQSIAAAMKRVGNSTQINLGTSSKQISALSQPLGRITGQADEFSKSMAAANARVLAFGASAGIIAGVSAAMAGLVTSTIKVEKSLVEINSVLNKSSAELDKFGQDIFNVAKNTGKSFDEVANGALELARQGLDAEDTLIRLNDALILSRLSGLDAAQSVEGLTAAFNSFQSSGITTAEILNKVVAVSQKFAVSEKDLIEGIKRSASVAQQAGVSFDELAAVITAVQERTARGGAVIGNSFKTIFARIQRKDVLSDLQNLGIGVTDLEGNVLPALKILQNLADKLGEFDQIEQANIAEKLGGVFQLDKLLAALKDLSSESSVTAEALKAAATAGNSAYEKNIVLNTTLASLLNKVSVSAEQLGAKLGEIGVTDSLKNVLGFFNSLLEGIQKVLGEESGLGNLVRGLVKGLGSFLAGPGLVLFGAIILKLSKDLVQFGFASLKTFFGIGKAAKEVQSIEGAISQILARNVDLQQQLFAKEGNRAAQLKIITSALIEQEAILRRSSAISAGLAAPLYNVGGRATDSGLRLGGGRTTGNSAGGYMPAVAKENAAIKQGVGGARSGDKPVVMPNFNFGGGKKGTMVAHTGEYVVPNFNGSGGSAVFNRRMVQSMGLPSGAKKIGAAGGFVPNFARGTGLGPAGLLDQLNLTGNESIDSVRSILSKNFPGSKISDKAITVKYGNENLYVTNDNIRTNLKRRSQTSQELYYNSNNSPAALMLVPQNRGFSPNELNTKFAKKRPENGLIFDGFIGGIAGVNPNPNDAKFSSLTNVDNEIAEALSNSAVNILNRIEPGIKITPESALNPKNILNSVLAEGGAGAFGSFKGALFESVIKLVTKGKGQEGGTLDVDFNQGRDALEAIFGIQGKGYDYADFKNSSGQKDKFISQVMKNLSATKYPKKAQKGMSAAGGYIPNFAKYIYDSDRLAPDKGATLNSILASKVKKNLIIGPAGSGKSTFAGRSGQFLSGIDDIAKATEIDILSGAARAKGGGLSKGLESIIAAVNASGGKVSYLYAKNLEILARRSGRTSPAEGDLRSVKQLKGTKYAPLNQFDFLGNVKSKSARFNLIQAAAGYIPNFVSKSREMGSGASGTFFRLGKNKEGTDVGVKKFKNYIPSRSIEAEWLTSEFVNKYANIPGVFGPKNLSSLEDSKRKKAIRKEVVSDPLARTALGSQKASDFGQKVLFAAFKARGLQIGDFHGSNYTLNKNAQDSINGMQNFPSDPVGAFSILRQIAASGGRIGAIDVGAANVTDPARSIIGQIMARQASQKTAAEGFIPNFAVDLTKSQDYINSQRKRNFKAGTYRKASGTIGSLFKSLPEKFFTDGILGDGAQGAETSGILNLIKENALYAASFAGPKSVKFVTEAEKYGLKVEKSLKDKLAKLVVKGASKMKGFAGGFMPNFADPLKEAIGREMAAGVPASQIYVDKNSSLKNTMNPMGLMVANRRDEPAGGFQGVNRARREGANPMMYGAAGGFVPNYAPQIGQVRSNMGVGQSKLEIDKFNAELQRIGLEIRKGTMKYTTAMQAMQSFAKGLQLNNFQQKQLTAKGAVLVDAYEKEISTRNQKAQKLRQDRTENRSQTPASAGNRDMLGTIFAVQGALSALTGATEGATGGLGALTNGLSSAAGSATTALFATQGLSQAFGGAEKGVGKFLGKLGPYAAAAAFLYTGFNELTKYLDKTNPEIQKAAAASNRLAEAAGKAAINLNNINPATKERIEKESKLFLQAIGIVSNLRSKSSKTTGQKITGSIMQAPVAFNLYNLLRRRSTSLTGGLSGGLEDQVLNAMSQARGVGIPQKEINEIVMKYAKEGALNYAGNTTIEPKEAEDLFDELTNRITKIGKVASPQAAFGALTTQEQKTVGTLEPKQVEEILKLAGDIGKARKKALPKSKGGEDDRRDLDELMAQTGVKEITAIRDYLYDAGIKNVKILAEGIRDTVGIGQDEAKQKETQQREERQASPRQLEETIKALKREKIEKASIRTIDQKAATERYNSALALAGIETDLTLSASQRAIKTIEAQAALEKQTAELEAQKTIQEDLNKLTAAFIDQDLFKGSDAEKEVRETLNNLKNNPEAQAILSSNDRKGAAIDFATKQLAGTSLKENDAAAFKLAEAILKALNFQEQTNQAVQDGNNERAKGLKLDIAKNKIQEQNNRASERYSQRMSEIANDISNQSAQVAFASQIKNAKVDVQLAQLSKRTGISPFERQDEQRRLENLKFQNELKSEREKNILDAKAELARNSKIDDNILALNENNEATKENSEVLKRLIETIINPPTSAEPNFRVLGGADDNAVKAGIGAGFKASSSLGLTASQEEIKQAYDNAYRQAYEEEIARNPPAPEKKLETQNIPTTNVSLEDKFAKAQELSKITDAQQRIKAAQDYTTELKLSADAALSLQKNLLSTAQTLRSGIDASAAKESLRELEERINVIKEAIESIAKIEKGQLEDQLVSLQASPSTFVEGMENAFLQMQVDSEQFAYLLGKDIPKMFADGMSNAINSAVDGTVSIKDGLRSAAYEFIKAINQRTMSNLINKIVGGGGTGGGIVGFLSGMFGANSKASGGMITGGSGTKDDVPAMLMGGEYVVNKKAVSKYGAQFLESLNNGTLMGYAKGGSVQKGPQGNFYAPGTFGQGAIEGKRNLLDFATQTGTSGKFDQMINESGYQSVSLEPESSMLSVFGMRNSPMFEATQSAKEQAFDLYLQQYNQEREAKKAEKEAKKAFRTQLIMMAASAIATPVIGAAASGFGAAFKGAAGQGIMSQLGAGFKGVFTGGNIGGTQVGGLGNLFSSVGKAFTGDFAGAGNQFKLSQIGSVKQLTDLYKSDKSFASYFDSMGGFNTSGAPRAIEASGFGGGVFQSGNVNRFAGGAEASDIAEAQRGLGITSDVESSTPRSNMFKKIFGGIGGVPSRIRNLFGGLGTGYGNGIFDEYGNYNEEAAAAWEKANGWGRATGGMIPSMSGIDTVPAMLSGGEFVMNRSAVQGIGTQNLQSMNSGGTSITSEETSKELNEKLLAKLDELISSSASTGNITINVAPSGQTTQETSQDPSAGRQQLARQIKDAVLQIINDEKRIGGTLRR